MRGDVELRRLNLLVLLGTLLLTLAACGAKPPDPAETQEPPPVATEQATPEPTEEPKPGPAEKPIPEPTEEPSDPVTDALEQYRIIVGQAVAYQYDPYAEPSGNYRYALVRMQPEDTVPTLLLEQETTDYLYYAIVFRYDPQSKTVIQPTGSLMEGMSQIGGYRGGLAMQGDGNGFQVSELSAGTGQTDIYRVTLDGDSLKKESQWSGMMDAVPAELGFIQIEWHEIGDTAALDSWTPGEIPQPGETSQPETPVESGTETLPEDGDRLVLTGTLNEYSYDDVAAMAENYPASDFERELNPTYWLIVLDEPQTIEIMSGGGPELVSGEATLIGILEPAGLEQYAGQHITFSIDPSKTYWPSDVSLPSGPRTNDVHILN